MLKQTNINFMLKSCSGKINKTSYDDSGKQMKQTSFTEKKPGSKPSQKSNSL